MSNTNNKTKQTKVKSSTAIKKEKILDDIDDYQIDTFDLSCEIDTEKDK